MNLAPEMIPLKYLCEGPPAYGLNESSGAYAPEGVRFIRTTDITESGELTPPESGVYLAAALTREHGLRTGDLLLSRSGTLGRALLFDEARHGTCSFAGYLVRFRPRSSVDARFLFYFTKSQIFEDQLLESAIQTTIGNFNAQKYGAMRVPLLPFNRQRAIAAFLDRRTGAIDALIAQKERLLELLAEKRQAVITEAVTKGLEPGVAMKESSVEWIGRVPAHWSIRPLKYVAMFQRGHDLPSEQREPGSVPVVSSGGVIGTHSATAARGPGIVTGRYGSIGQFTYLEEDYWPLNTALYSRELWGNSARWVYYAVSVLAPIFVMESKKSAVPGVDRNDLHPYRVAVPPRLEQDVISAFLDAYEERSAQATTRLREAIDGLREYRQALITAAVTGQVDIAEQQEAA